MYINGKLINLIPLEYIVMEPGTREILLGTRIPLF